MERFGDEEDESSDLFDDEMGGGYGRSPEAVAWDSPKKGGFVLVAKVLVAAMILIGCASVIWFAR